MYLRIHISSYKNTRLYLPCGPSLTDHTVNNIFTLNNCPRTKILESPTFYMHLLIFQSLYFSVTMFKLSLSTMTQVWVYLVTLCFLLLLQRFTLRGPYQEQLLSHSVILSWLSRSHGELALYRAQSLLS